MFNHRILYWGLLGSLVFAVLLGTIDIALDDINTRVYNEDMVLLFQINYSERIVLPPSQVEVALDWKDAYWETAKTAWQATVKALKSNTRQRKREALSCLDGLRHAIRADDSLKQAKVSSNKCRCGITLGPDTDNKAITDKSSPYSFFSSVQSIIQLNSFDGNITSEWAPGTKYFLGFVMDYKDDWSSVDNTMARWKAELVSEYEDSLSKTWGHYFKRYLKGWK
ncbi:MAG: hypothetical protein J3Q66DRAFT_374751 [Benniella sp.]|nr:MAG: hypothetical protein J3Q66DRAFT_374751 [Benniella sp.]